MVENEDKLINAIDRLEKATRRTTNFWWTILRGLAHGFGWVIGLALIATLAIYILPLIGEGNAVGKFIQAIASAVKSRN
jgi:hypothetical protein